MKDLNFVTQDGKIDTELLKENFDTILADAEKSNKGVAAAGRRFRLNTVAMANHFLAMRKVSQK